MQEPSAHGKWTSPGGTPGGMSHFLIGLGLASAGLWLLMGRVIVSSRHFLHGWFGQQLGGQGTVAVIVVPFLLGVGGLFVNGKSVWAWSALLGSMVLLLVTILSSLELSFMPTSLPAFLGMLAMIASGFGLIVRSLKSQ